MNQQKLPNATAVLILGITAFVGCLCTYGVVGLILAIVGLYLAGKDEKLYRQNPEMYSDYGNLKAGKILSLISLIMSILYILMMIIFLAMFGMEALTDPELMQERIRELGGQ